jgi:transglutaminase-like putative cysteine protease
MNLTSARRILVTSLFATLLTLAPPIAHADHWTTPTPEELKMTSQPEVPGAPAVYLYREETTEDKMHRFTVYVRLKVLTEGGKEYGNVELEYAHNSDGGSVSVENIEGRTIHPDGTIIPFTGKPYDKLIEKNQGVRVMSKVFSLPDVEVGSIIEYRYSRYLDDRYFMAPQWYIQSKLFTRKAHYLWKPTGDTLISSDDRGQLTNTIAWTPILPPNTQVKQVEIPSAGPNGSPQVTIEVDVHDIPPAPEEEYMPPVTSFTYRVLFYYSPYRNAAEYWKNEGKHWSKLQDKFIGPGPAVGAAVQQLTAPSDTQDQKLRKLYAAVMQLENTDFTREHSTTEDKSLGLGKIQNTDDILARKRGSSDQLAELFVAMARAAGMKAYVAALTNRDRHVFNPSYLSLSQLDDDIAIVNVDGKEQYFDPGSRYCPYQHLAWKHTIAGGIRQTDKGTDMAGTPFEPYTFSRIQRIADLKMDEHGIVTGTVKMAYTGAPALSWRHRSLTGDSTSLEQQLKANMESLLPAGMDVKVGDIQQLTDYEQPLVVNYTVKGPIASSAGKRILLSSDLFESNSKPTFPHEKRDLSVYFEYTKIIQDAVRITFPPTLAVESLPATAKFNYLQAAAYGLISQSTPNSFTFRRELALGDVIFKREEYSGLRSFYGQFENKDQESVVLTTATPTTAVKSGSPAN